MLNNFKYIVPPKTHEKTMIVNTFREFVARRCSALALLRSKLTYSSSDLRDTQHARSTLSPNSSTVHTGAKSTRHRRTTGQPKPNCGHFYTIIQLNHIKRGTTMGEHRCERITPSPRIANSPQPVFTDVGDPTIIIILYTCVYC